MVYINTILAVSMFLPLFTEAVNKLTGLLIWARLMGPLFGLIIGLIYVWKYLRDASFFTIIFTISFWMIMGEIAVFTILFFILFIPPIPIPGVNPVYVFIGLVIVEGVLGSYLFLVGYRRVEEEVEEPLEETEVEGEEAIHIMVIGDEPEELPPDERGRITGEGSGED